MFLTPVETLFERLPVFILVLFRVSGLTMFGPLLGLSSIPIIVRGMTMFVIAMAIWPLVPGVVFQPDNWVELTVSITGEIIIGASMGLILLFIFSGIKMGAELISQQMGLSMSKMVDPVSGTDVTLIQQLYNLLLTTFYILINGHLVLIHTIADTFKTIPLASSVASEPIMRTLVNVLLLSFQAGIRIAGPVIVAVFLATIALGFISRTMPQLNILAAGFPMRILLTMFIMITALGAAFEIFDEYIIIAFKEIGGLFYQRL